MTVRDLINELERYHEGIEVKVGHDFAITGVEDIRPVIDMDTNLTQCCIYAKPVTIDRNAISKYKY